MAADDKNIPYRVGQLESGMNDVRTDVKDILVNHLPHIQIEIMRVNTLLKIFGGLILTALSALIAIGLS
jgi:hypothetical protein